MLLLFLSTAYAATAADLSQSMAVPTADVVQATFQGHAVTNDVLTQLGILTPNEGIDFAYMTTGRVGSPPEPGEDLPPMGRPQGDRATLTLQLKVPANANSLAFDFYFLSAEYPEYVGTQYNDEFTANVTGTAWSGNAAQDSQGNNISVNSALFSVTQSNQLTGTGFDKGVGGGTGWLTTLVPANPGDVLTLEFSIFDASDGVYDSSVLLDDFYWSESEISTPVIVGDLDVDFLSPKRGPTAGGVTTSVFGEGFNETCTASFDGVEAVSTTFVDESELVAEVPPHAAALVDVVVECIGVSNKLIGGYTYYDEEAGALPPVIDAVEPYTLDPFGGELVTVIGQDFVDGLQLFLDGDLVAATWLDATRLEFESPAHDPGLAAIEIVNPDGLLDYRDGAVLYLENPTWPPEDTAVVDTQNPDTGDDGSASSGKMDGGCGCGAPVGVVPGVFWSLMFGLGLFWRRSQ